MSDDNHKWAYIGQTVMVIVAGALLAFWLWIQHLERMNPPPSIPVNPPATGTPP